MIAKVRIYEYNDVLEHLKVLRQCVDDGSRLKLVEEMQAHRCLNSSRTTLYSSK